jgi:hypothetical protein
MRTVSFQARCGSATRRGEDLKEETVEVEGVRAVGLILDPPHLEVAQRRSIGVLKGHSSSLIVKRGPPLVIEILGEREASERASAA